MPLGIFEINDAGIQTTIDGDIVNVSPGYAVLDGEKLLIGEEGMANSRLLPRWTNNRFWNELGTDPITGQTANIRHHADLAFAHLESLWQSVRGQVDEVVFIVPGFYSREQLGLLLGMAQECDMPVAGIVDNALVSVCQQPLTPTTLHLEIYLHRITLTALSADGRLAQRETQTVTETGLFTLWDRWANVIANQFIQASRFDPLHQAVSEQKLFDRLPDWIQNLRTNRGNTFDLHVGEVNHSVAVSSEQLMKACARIYPLIVQDIRSLVPAGEIANLYISHRFRGFPGFEDSLQLLNNVRLFWLERNHTINGALAHKDKIVSGSDAVSHVVNLPIEGAQQSRSVSRSAGRPTHMLSGNHATAIGTSFKLGANLNDGISEDLDNPVAVLYPRGDKLIIEVRDNERVKVNDQRVDQEISLAAGDRFTIDGHEITLISVSKDGR
ncbi:MAG: hypothetical protein WD356_06235 [Pseudomonadales bacterium]